MVQRLVGAILIGENKKILLGLRSNSRSFYPGVWDVIGGHCIEYERFEDALERELLEEINIKPTHFKEYKTIDKSPAFILKLFIVFNWEGEVTNIDDSEHEKIDWFTFTKAKTLTFPDKLYYQILSDIENKF